MQRDDILAEMKDKLANLYSEEYDIREFIREVGMKEAEIAFTGKASTIWSNIIVDADHKEKLLDIIRVAQKRYPNNQVIQKWKQGFTTSNQKPRRANIEQLLARAEQEQRPLIQTQKKVKIDKDVIIGYNLETSMYTFRKELGYKGAFAFSIAGDSIILEHYILERLIRELKLKTERPCIKFIIRLYPHDISLAVPLIEHKLSENKYCDNLSNLFSANPKVDIVLIVWNYKIPLAAMRPVARSFWQEVITNISPCLEKQGRCFVVIWSNVGFRKHLLDEFIDISTPSEFKVHDLTSWFHGRLNQLGIENDVIKQYLHRLKNQQGHLLGTYQEMQGIIQELKGGVTLYE